MDLPDFLVITFQLLVPLLSLPGLGRANESDCLRRTHMDEMDKMAR